VSEPPKDLDATAIALEIVRYDLQVAIPGSGGAPAVAECRREVRRDMSRGFSAVSLWQRLGCCLTGHDYSVSSDRTRMFVRCNSCGHTSRGLEIHKDMFRAAPRDEPAGAADRRARAGRSSLATQ
jgi:hypothetical protein